MAATYDVVVQYPGLDVIGGTQVQDVIFVGITTKPHGTYLEFPIPVSVYNATQVDDYAIGYSGTVEFIWSLTYVVGVQWTQVVNASNQLQSSYIVTVESTSGNSTGTVTLALAQLAPSIEDPLIAAMHDHLDAVEAL